MDDFKIATLQESRNEWVSRLVNILTPHIMDGFKSIFTESYKLCMENDEEDKYLMTFQNFLTRVPKWNDELINSEVKRITENSNCTYIDDLITCVHIVQLKALTCIRVGQKQKKIDIDIPKLKDFVHKIYIHVARKVYTNVYLFEKNLQPLDLQRNNRELELIVKECILNSVRESIPIDHILRSYLDETEEEIEEEEKPSQDDTTVTPIEESIKLKKNDNLDISTDVIDMKLDIKELGGASKPESPKPASPVAVSKPESPKPASPVVVSKPESPKPPSPIAVSKPESPKPASTVVNPRGFSSPITSISTNTSSSPPSSPTLGKAIKFSNYDKEISVDKEETVKTVPKTIDNLENISNTRHEQRKLEEMADDEEDDGPIKIMDDINLNIDVLDINTL